jgi:non-heme Fe2+,alpha-ketoglutarate-dependent halogenase
MSKVLSAAQVAAYERDGYIFPVSVMPGDEMLAFRDRLESYEATTGAPIQGNLRHKVHLLFTWANDLVRDPRILDAVEDLIGPDILCWGTNFFIKEAHDDGFVSWHQDSTYWGLEPPDVITAWLAFSDATVENGAMKFLPGSHKLDQIAHRDTFHENNLLTRGQEVAMEIDEKAAVDAPIRAGEMTLHHVRLVHGSTPNQSADRRIALSIRYIPTHVRQRKMRDSATLVRGADRFGHFDHEPDPVANLDEAAHAAHAEAMRRQVAFLYQGTEHTEMRK